MSNPAESRLTTRWRSPVRPVGSGPDLAGSLANRFTAGVSISAATWALVLLKHGLAAHATRRPDRAQTPDSRLPYRPGVEAGMAAGKAAHVAR